MKIIRQTIEPAKFLSNDDIIIQCGLMIAGSKYQKNLNYEDSLLYCSLLTIGDTGDWRFPSEKEVGLLDKFFSKKVLIWNNSKKRWIEEWKNSKLLCVPVRTVK